MASTPAIDGWFRTGERPALLGSRCAACGHVCFPPETTFCKNPLCASESFEEIALSRRGRVWSYTDARYQPPPPYVPRTDPYQPFALAAVELPEGLTVMGQVADGFTTEDLHVGCEVELVVETLYRDETGERTIWRWRPVPADGTPPSRTEEKAS